MTNRNNDHYHPWTTYIAAREEARRRGNRRVGTDHLLLGLLRDGDVATVLDVTLDIASVGLEGLDRDALTAVGLADVLEAPLLPERPLPERPTLEAVLKDRLPLTPAAKSALKEAAASTRRGQRITPMVLLAVLLEHDCPDPGITLLSALGTDVEGAKRRVARLLAA